MSQAEFEKRINYVEFPVPSIEEAKRFYGQAFGWTFEDWGPEYASFSDGRMNGGFRQEAEVRHGGPLVILYSADLGSMKAQVQEAGGTIVSEIEFPGGRRFHFRDPAGHELAVWSEQ
jgi:uncharacterized protein